MWCDNSTTNSYGYNRHCKCYNTPYCQTITVPNLCTVCHANMYVSANPMNQWYNNVLPDNQLAPQFPISSFSYNQQINEQTLQQNNGCLNHGPWAGNQYPGQFNNQLQLQSNYDGNYGLFPDQILKFSQGVGHNPASLVNASLPPTGSSNGNFSNIMDIPREWGPSQFSFQHGNLLEETVGSRSNSTSISSEGTQKLVSLDESKKQFEHPPMSRKDRVLRYFEKKKTRKYDKKIQFSSRKAYARTRPRVRGRFTRSSQKDTTTTVE